MTDRGAGLAVLPVLDLEGDGGAALGGEALLLLEGLAGRTRRDRDVLVEPAPRVHRSPVRARVCVFGVRFGGLEGEREGGAVSLTACGQRGQRVGKGKRAAHERVPRHIL